MKRNQVEEANDILNKRQCDNSPTDSASADMKKELAAFVAVAETSDLSLSDMHARLHRLHVALSRSLSPVVDVRAGACVE